MTASDFIPHGMITALAGAVVYIFKGHQKQDNDRYTELKNSVDKIFDCQTVLAKTIADNHAQVLQQFIDAGRHAATNAAIAEGREFPSA
jgi:hypothetical protein